MGNKIVHKTRHVKKTLQPEWYRQWDNVSNDHQLNFTFSRNESFSAPLNGGSSILDIKIKDKNTLNDVDIGDCFVNVAELLQNQNVYEGWLPLEPQGTGEVHIRMDISSDGGDNGSSTSRGLFGRK